MRNSVRPACPFLRRSSDKRAANVAMQSGSEQPPKRVRVAIDSGQRGSPTLTRRGAEVKLPDSAFDSKERRRRPLGQPKQTQLRLSIVCPVTFGVPDLDVLYAPLAAFQVDDPALST